MSLVYMFCLANCFFFCLQLSKHFACILNILLVLSNSNVSTVLNLLIKLWVFELSLIWATTWHVETVNQNIKENNLFGQHDHTIEFTDSFQFCNSLITLHHYLWYQFFFVTLSTLMFFFLQPLQMITILGQMKKFLANLMTQLYYLTTWSINWLDIVK